MNLSDDSHLSSKIGINLHFVSIPSKLVWEPLGLYIETDYQSEAR